MGHEKIKHNEFLPQNITSLRIYETSILFCRNNMTDLMEGAPALYVDRNSSFW